MKRALFIGIISSLLLSCGPKISEKQAKKLNKLSTSIDSSVSILLNEIDSSRLVELTDDFFYKKSFFENDMNDTIDTETIFIIDDYIRNKKAMEYVRINFAPLIQEAKVVQNQIQDLKHDVKNRLVDQEQFEKYYDLELNNFNQLEDAVNRIKMIYVKMDTTIVQMNPKIDSIINAYKSKVDA